MRDQAGRAASDAEFWEETCAQALLDFLWQKAEAPPAIFPLYEMPSLPRSGGRGPVRWGPYAS